MLFSLASTDRPNALSTRGLPTFSTHHLRACLHLASSLPGISGRNQAHHRRVFHTPTNTAAVAFPLYGNTHDCSLPKHTHILDLYTRSLSPQSPSWATSNRAARTRRARRAVLTACPSVASTTAPSRDRTPKTLRAHYATHYGTKYQGPANPTARATQSLVLTMPTAKLTSQMQLPPSREDRGGAPSLQPQQPCHQMRLQMLLIRLIKIKTKTNRKRRLRLSTVQLLEQDMKA